MSKTNGHADDTHAEDKLIEVPQYSLIKFRNMFKANWPAHITAYYLIENYMEWLEKVNNIKNLKIFSLNGEWRKDGTFVIVVSRLFMPTVPINFNFFSCNRIAIACSCTRLMRLTRSLSAS